MPARQDEFEKKNALVNRILAKYGLVITGSDALKILHALWQVCEKTSEAQEKALKKRALDPKACLMAGTISQDDTSLFNSLRFRGRRDRRSGRRLIGSLPSSTPHPSHSPPSSFLTIQASLFEKKRRPGSREKVNDIRLWAKPKSQILLGKISSKYLSR